MAQFFNINLTNPQHRLITQTADILYKGGIIIYPTDSGYAIGCMLGNSEAQTRIRQIRGVSEEHFFTLICRNLSELGNYAIVSNSQFRLLKANTPGAYTFILQATREVPRKLQHPKRNTIGIRVPQHAIVDAILEAINAPLLSMTLDIQENDAILSEAWEIRDKLEHQVDLVIDAGNCTTIPTSIIDLTTDLPMLVRVGQGDLLPFGLR